MPKENEMARRLVRIALVLVLALAATGIVLAGGVSEKPAEKAAPAMTAPAAKPGKYKEAPDLAEAVKAGKLPPVEQRLPENPMVITPIEKVGIYGGTWKFFIDSQSRLVDVGEFTDVGLLHWNRDQSGPEPCVAEGWEVKDGGREFVIKLRKGLKWSDGQPFTADDVVFWWQDVVMNDQLYPVKPYYMFTASQKLGTVVKNDDYSVSFKFPEPHGMFILYLTKEIWTYAPKHYLTQFLPKYAGTDKVEALAKEKGFKTWVDLFRYKFNTFGPGATSGNNNPELPTLFPWVATQEPPGERFIFKRNPYFFAVDTEGNQLPYIDQVDVRVAKADVINLKIIAGEPNFQVSRQQAFQEMPLYMQYADKNEYNVYQWGDLQISECALWPNETTPDPVDRQIFRDVRFRRALSVAIDREKINKTLYSGMGKPTAATLPPVESKVYKEEYARAYTQYDPAQANKWLDEMGLTRRDADGYRLKPDGKRAAFVVEVPSERLGMIDNLNLIKDDYKAIGIEIIIKPEANTLWSTRNTGNQMQIAGWPMGKSATETDLVPISDNCDWGVAWGVWYNTGGKQGEEPPAYIKDLQEAWSTILSSTDEKTQLAMYDKILKANADNVWVIGVVGPVPKPIIVKKWFHNIKKDGVWSFHHGHFIGCTEVFQAWIEKAHQTD
jgi:peptide/nickel transport system substrate-binding protein